MAKIVIGKWPMNSFLNFYKNANVIIKIIFFGVLLIMGALWLLGSLTKIDRLVMFMVGALIGGTLINIFLYDYVVIAIDYVASIF